MDKMTNKDGETMDIVENNISQLKQLFPEVFSEDKIDFDRLQEALGNYVNDDEEHYKFTWHGKRAANRIAQSPSMGTLRPCKKESKDWGNTENLVIEGDNLEVLKLLQKSYFNSIKMIYIDPPYNTGKDFVYKDSFQDNIKNYKEQTGQVDSDGNRLSTNTDTLGRYHTNWLNMMYPRLKLARNLLSDDGVIFISIDDNEQSNLKQICDDVFGEENFVELFILRSNPRGNQAKKLTASEHDYLFCYSKNIKELKPMGFQKTEEEYNKEDSVGKYREMGLRKRGAGARREDAPNQFYSIFYNPETGDIEIDKKSDEYVEIIPKLANGDEGRWRWSYKSVLERKDELIVRQVNRATGLEYDVFVKDYFNENTISKIKSIMYDKEVNYETATRELTSLFDGKKYFDYPKPVALLNRIVQISTNQNDIVLDFFAGSGTTAHAVMELNAEDEGFRKCISVQLPELTDEKSEAYKAGYKKISDITKERIRRAGNKIKEEKGADLLSNGKSLDAGFKVFKLDESNIKTWDSSQENFDTETLQENLLSAVDNIKQDRSNDDLVYELLLKTGIDLSMPIETHEINDNKVLSMGAGALIICLDKDIQPATINGIVDLVAGLDPEESKVIFRDSSFKDDVAKTNALQTLRRNDKIKEIKTL